MAIKFSKLMSIINLNTFLYLLSRIPGIKHLGFKKLIAKENLKSKLGFLGVVVHFVFSFVLRMIMPFYIIVIGINKFIGVNEISSMYDLRVLIYLIIFCLTQAFANPSFLSDAKNAYMFMGIMGVDPRIFYRQKIREGIIMENLVHFIISYLIFKNYLVAFSIFIFMTACSYISNLINISYLLKHDRLIKKLLRTIYKLVLYAIAFLLVYFKVEIKLTNNFYYILSLLSLVISLFGIIYFYKFKSYNKIKTLIATSNNYSVGFVIATSMSEDYRELRGIKPEDNIKFLKDHKDLPSQAYIEKAFETRFKDILKKQFFSKTNGMIFTALLYIVFFKLGISAGNKGFTGLQTFGIVMVLSSAMAGTYLQMCFRNIDMPLMYHNLYDSEAIKKSISNRIRYIAKMVLPNFLLALVFVGLIGLINKVDFDFKQIPLTLAVYAMILITRELMEIIIYYVLCPYSSDLSNKSPVYKAIQGIMMTIIGISFMSSMDMAKVIYPVGGIFILTLLTFIILRKNFYKTFRIRY